MIELSRADRLARDTAQAVSLGYVLVREVVDPSGQTTESWGRQGLTSTMERSEQDGWLLLRRDEDGNALGSPTPIGVCADEGDDVFWALVEQDKPRFYRWRPLTDAGSPQAFVTTVADAGTTATIYRIDEYWFLTVSWYDGVSEDVALPESWTACEALVHGDLAMGRSQARRARPALAELRQVS